MEEDKKEKELKEMNGQVRMNSIVFAVSTIAALLGLFWHFDYRVIGAFFLVNIVMLYSTLLNVYYKIK